MTLFRTSVGAATAAFAWAMASVASAAFTYVDADFAVNTSPGSASAGEVTLPDSLWGQRAFGTNNTVYESSGTGSGTEDSPEIATTISGLNPGASYDVNVHFYDITNNSGQNWPIRAGFTPGALTLFANADDGGATALSAIGAGLASNLTYVTDPKFDDGGGRLLYAGNVGIATADINGEITVYVDDLPSTIGANNRTWYDGLSYQLIPEPTSGVLLFSCLVIAARRR